MEKPWDENDGRAPDTKDALQQEERKRSAATAPARKSTRSKKKVEPDRNPTASPLFLLSYKWARPNSCFIDGGLEIWFRAFHEWSEDDRTSFICDVPHESYLGTLFFHFQARLKIISDTGNPSNLLFHFQARLKILSDTAKPSNSRQYERALSMIQMQTLNKISQIWDIHNRDDYGCPMTWFQKAIEVSIQLFNGSLINLPLGWQSLFRFEILLWSLPFHCTYMFIWAPM